MFKIEELYPIYREIKISQKSLDEIKNGKNIKNKTDESVFPNEYYKLTSSENPQNSCLSRFDGESCEFVPLAVASSEIPHWLTAKNIEQTLALDALLNDDIALVTLVGKAGTGKTLLAVAAGLYKTIDCEQYERVLVARPTVSLGQDIGFLPGSIEEKLGPWMYPISDNVDFLIHGRKTMRSKIHGFSDLTERGILLIEPLPYIRGRSIHKQYLVIDEAQNLTLHEIKTILTRAGVGTKIILAGDPYQIDNPKINAEESGLMQVVKKFRNENLSSHITLVKCERSKLAETAANLL
ncbi:MAG: PhoH family protein [Chitinivibrionia bacterium]|nr:PhoH family protein [Chitinivibrionia bacterium]